MKRVLILGNSHAGALKSGWKALRTDFPDAEVSFFVAPSPTFALCRLDESGTFGLPDDTTDADPRRREVLERLNGATSIDLRSFDVVVWSGYGWLLEQVAAILARYDIDGLRESGAPSRMSQPAYRAMCHDISEASVPTGPWLRLDGPHLVIVTRPVPAESGLISSGDRKSTGWRRALQRGTPIGPALAVFFNAFATALDATGIGYVPAPKESFGPLGLTREAFTRGSLPLDNRREHDANDNRHMNGEYGALVMRELMARIGVPAQTH